MKKANRIRLIHHSTFKEDGIYEVDISVVDDKTKKAKRYKYYLRDYFGYKEFMRYYKAGKSAHGKALAILNKHKVPTEEEGEENPDSLYHGNGVFWCPIDKAYRSFETCRWRQWKQIDTCSKSCEVGKHFIKFAEDTNYLWRDSAPGRVIRKTLKKRRAKRYGEKQEGIKSGRDKKDSKRSIRKVKKVSS